MIRYSKQSTFLQSAYRFNNKDTLASQLMLSRFFNRMDEATLDQFNAINKKIRDIIYSIRPQKYILFDIDSTLLITYGEQVFFANDFWKKLQATFVVRYH